MQYNYSDSIRILTDAGLSVDENNRISCGGYDFGLLEGDEIVSGKTKIDLNEVSTIDLDVKTFVLGFIMDSGKRKRIIGKDMISGEPNPEVEGKGMPMSILDFNKAFEILFPDCRSQLYYDVLKEREIIDMAMLGEPEKGSVPLEDGIIKRYHLKVQERLLECGYVGKRFPSILVMDEVLSIRMGNNRRNLFREWVEAHDWDGKSRLRGAFMEYLGGTAPALRDGASQRSLKEVMYLEEISEKWFLGAIARMYGPAKHEVVPVFTGKQGIGKGTALRFLAGDNEWFASTTADVSKPARFLDTVRGAIIVEMGESKQIRERSCQEDLKAFISLEEDRLRKAYAKHDAIYPRHFILAATSNDQEVFVDSTGSRRFFPIKCESELVTKDISSGSRPRELQYEVEQIWAEALHVFKTGVKPYPSREVMGLARVVQDYATEKNPLVELVISYLDTSIEYSAVDSRFDRVEFMEILAERGYASLFECQNAWKEWTKADSCWEKHPSRSTTLHGRSSSSVYVRIKAAKCRNEPVKTFRIVD